MPPGYASLRSYASYCCQQRCCGIAATPPPPRRRAAKLLRYFSPPPPRAHGDVSAPRLRALYKMVIYTVGGVVGGGTRLLMAGVRTGRGEGGRCLRERVAAAFFLPPLVFARRCRRRHVIVKARLPRACLPHAAYAHYFCYAQRKKVPLLLFCRRGAPRRLPFCQQAACRCARRRRHAFIVCARAQREERER